MDTPRDEAVEDAPNGSAAVSGSARGVAPVGVLHDAAWTHLRMRREIRAQNRAVICT